MLNWNAGIERKPIRGCGVFITAAAELNWEQIRIIRVFRNYIPHDYRKGGQKYFWLLHLL